MKILQIIADGAPGGGTTFILQMLRSLDSPVFLTQKNSHALEQTEDIPKYGIDFFTSRFDFRIARNIQKIIDQIKPELIHVHGGRAAFFLSFCKKRCPVLYTVHGLHAIHQGRFLSRWGGLRGLSYADHITFVSHADKNLALQKNLLRNTPYSVIHHGIDLRTIPEKRKPIPKLIGFMGRLADEKDPLFMLEVMKILGPKGYRLRVIGGGKYENVMRKNPYTTVSGELARETSLKLLSEVEVVVAPSKWEAFGLVTLEAMALEIPLIGAQIPSFEEILGGGRFATLIKEKDPKKYALAIEEKIDYSQDAKSHLLENFLWERCLTQYQAIFDDLKKKNCYPGMR